MAFSPTLEVCQPNCSTIQFIDTTNVYNSESNTSGWAGSNINTEDVTAATIVVTDTAGNIQFTYDVLSQLPDPVTGEIIFTDYSTSLTDGNYIVTYTITTSGDIYTHSQTIAVTCNFECCISKQLSKIAKAVCADSCDTSTVDEYLLIEGLLYAYKAAAMCEKTDIKEKIKLRLQRFCDYQCDDC